MRRRVALLFGFAVALLGCEDDARDLDHLKPKPIVASDGGVGAGLDASGSMAVPDAGADAAQPPVDAATTDDGGSDDAG